MEAKQATVLIIVMASLLATGCAGYRAADDSAAPLGIGYDRQNYTLLLSSAPGLGLTPEYPASVDNRTVEFRWHTDFGYFVDWGRRDSKVTSLGPDVTTDDGKVYWTFAGNESENMPPVHVTLAMVDRATGRSINTASLDIGWENGYLAVVKK